MTKDKTHSYKLQCAECKLKFRSTDTKFAGTFSHKIFSDNKVMAGFYCPGCNKISYMSFRFTDVGIPKELPDQSIACIDCANGRRTTNNNTCVPTMEIDGKVYNKIPFGTSMFERQFFGRPFKEYQKKRCSECHVKFNMFHHKYCVNQTCPKCLMLRDTLCGCMASMDNAKDVGVIDQKTACSKEMDK